MTLIENTTMDTPELPSELPPPYTPTDPNAPSSVGSPTTARYPESPNSPGLALRGGYITHNPTRHQSRTEALETPAPSASSYFQERGRPARIPSPVLTIQRTLHRHVNPTKFSVFPFSVIDSTTRDVTEQDWATFCNYVLSSLGLDPGSPKTSGTSLTREDFVRRRIGVGQVVAEWNEAFWRPRGVKVEARFDVDRQPSADSTPSLRTVQNAQGEVVGTTTFQQGTVSPFVHAELPAGSPEAYNPPLRDPLTPHVPINPETASIHDSQGYEPPPPQAHFAWARGLLGRGGHGLGRGRGRGWDHHHARRGPHSPHGVQSHVVPDPVPRRQRSASVASDRSHSSTISTSASEVDLSPAYESESEESISSLDSDNIEDANLEELRGAIAGFHIDTTDKQAFRASVQQLRREVKEARQKFKQGGCGKMSKEQREARRAEIKATKAEFRSLKRELKHVMKEQRKKRKQERKAKYEQRKNERKQRVQNRRVQRQQRRRGGPIPPPEGSILFEQPTREQPPSELGDTEKEKSKEQVTGIVERPPSPPPTYHTDEKSLLQAREQEQVSSVASSLGLDDASSTAGTVYNPPPGPPPAFRSRPPSVMQPANRDRSFSPPRPTSAHTALSRTPTPPNTVSSVGIHTPPSTVAPDEETLVGEGEGEQADGEVKPYMRVSELTRQRVSEDRAIVLERVAEDRARALERAALAREQAEVDRQRALDRAAQDRERAHRRAQTDRDRAAAKREYQLARETQEREKALAVARAAREKAEAKAREAREKAEAKAREKRDKDHWKRERKWEERHEKLENKRAGRKLTKSGNTGPVADPPEQWHEPEVGETSAQGAQREALAQYGGGFAGNMEQWGESFGGYMQGWGERFGQGAQNFGQMVEGAGERVSRTVSGPPSEARTPVPERQASTYSRAISGNQGNQWDQYLKENESWPKDEKKGH